MFIKPPYSVKLEESNESSWLCIALKLSYEFWRVVGLFSWMGGFGCLSKKLFEDMPWHEMNLYRNERGNLESQVDDWWVKM